MGSPGSALGADLLITDTCASPGGQPIVALDGVLQVAGARVIVARFSAQIQPDFSRRCGCFYTSSCSHSPLAVLVSRVLILMTLDLLGASGRILAIPQRRRAVEFVGCAFRCLRPSFLPFRCCWDSYCVRRTQLHSEVTR